MVKTIFEILKFNTILHKLIKQQISFPINISYKLFKLKEELNEIESLIFERWDILFGENYDINELNDEQITLYNVTLQSEIEIDFFGLKKEDIISNTEAKLTIQDIEIVNIFFKNT